jgi:hypothetical protein
MALSHAETWLPPAPSSQVFQRHGVEQYNPAGDKFDPNLHSAMFEVPDASKEAGVIAMVTKVGNRAGWTEATGAHRCWLAARETPRPLAWRPPPPPAGHGAVAAGGALAAAPCCPATPHEWPSLLLPPPCGQRGYKMHDRILRAAEVGVYKQP